ncbi:MAG TPA: nif-specific transcriptional activator NifA [Spirochaetes bacterium]|nr:nif-specific transcriptional activator NifA [Spirochaetota bacterium]
MDFIEPDTKIKNEIKELSLLFRITRILDSSIDLRDVVGPVLKALSENTDIERGAIALLNRETGEISIESADGLSTDQKIKGRYRLGEGITGKVVQTGKPAVVPRISEEPLFLDKTGARKGANWKDLSFICVPVKLGNKVIGTLSADIPFSEKTSLEDYVRLLSIVASLLSQAVRLRQSVQEEKQRLLEENTRLHDELKNRFNPTNLIGNSKAMREVYNLIDQVYKSDTTVLILGENGTGKEMVAHAIHYNSLRASKPFIKVNCAALPETVIESELFGHEKGAFTGAVSMRKGRFELAHGGTIFLDEIGDLTPATQIRLLRVLQEKEFERVGGTSTIKTNVRIITATNRDLEDLIRKNEFRQDLYYRLNVFPIHLPHLKNRKADILLLADHFVEKYSSANNKNIRRISTPAIDMMMAYHWPGNVRELENCIERAVLLSNDDVIHGHHLPPSLQTAEASGTTQKSTLKAAVENLEREIIQEALKSSRGNMAKAARALGLTERVISLRVRKLGIDPRRFHA